MSAKYLIILLSILLSLPAYPNIDNTDSEYQITNEKVIEQWSGSCIAIGNRLVATNFHVIDNAKQIVVTCFNGDNNTRYRAEVVLTDQINDLAVLRITDERFKGFDIKYGTKEKVSDIGTSVFVLGYPLTTTMGEDIKLTTGVISSKSGFLGNISQYQISAPIQPGNSGGPLFDNDGNLIGIVSAKHIGAENVGYAIKLNYLRNLLDSSVQPITMSLKNSISNLSLPNKIKAISSCVLMVLAISEKETHITPQQGNGRVDSPDDDQNIDRNAVIAHNYMLAGQEDSAHVYYKKANIYKLGKNELNEFARCSYFTGHFDNAVNACLEGIKLDPKNTVFNRLIMFSYYELQQYTEAKKYMDIYFNDLDDVEFSEYDHFYAALILRQLKEYKQSLLHCEMILKKLTDLSMLKRWTILRTISDIQEDDKNYICAIIYYQDYLDSKPNPNFDDYDGLAKLYSRYAEADENKKEEMINKAIKTYRQIGKRYPTQIAYTTYMCAAMYNKLDENGKRGLAKEDFQKVVKLLEPIAIRKKVENTMLINSYHYLMNNALFYGQNKKLAIEYANKIVAIDPNYEAALRIIRM